MCTSGLGAIIQYVGELSEEVAYLTWGNEQKPAKA